MILAFKGRGLSRAGAIQAQILLPGQDSFGTSRCFKPIDNPQNYLSQPAGTRRITIGGRLR
jgi:hypothetical protein